MRTYLNLAALLVGFLLTACATPDFTDPRWPNAAHPPGPIPTPSQSKAEAPSAAPALQPSSSRISRPDTLRAGFSPVKVGLLLPLSGPETAIGQAMQRAAQTALKDAAAVDLTLVPFDSRSDPMSAAQAARRMADEGITIALGPLYRAELEAVQAAAPNITWVSFSNDYRLGTAQTHLLGHDGGAMAGRLMQFAADRGATRIVALLPDTPYGARVLEGAQRALADSAKPARLIAVETYPAASTAPAVAKLAYELGRADAVLLGDGPEGLRAALLALAGQGLDRARQKILIADALDSSLLEDVLFENIYYAAPDNENYGRFLRRYIQDHGVVPPPFAALAYDGVRLLYAYVAAYRRDNRPFDPLRLNSSEGIEGAEGFLRLGKAGLAERAYAVFETPAANQAPGAPEARPSRAAPPLIQTGF